MSVEAAIKPAASIVSSADRAPATVIRKAAVLGAVTMGSRIAAHLANAGLPVVLLDIPAPEGARSALASQALDALRKNKPAAFYDPAFAARVSVGNFDDDLALLADCDWVIEAVTENLAIKQGLLEKVIPHLKRDAILTTNTSGLPVASIAAKLPEAVRRRWFGTHFFNPPRYMRLVEIIPTPEADPAAIAAVSHFASPYRFCADHAAAFHANPQLALLRGRHKLVHLHQLRHKVLRPHQQFAALGNGHRLHRPRMHAQVGNRRRLFHMQRPIPPVIPQPVSDIGILLDLAQHNPGADRVHRVRRGEIGFPGLHRHPVDELFDLARPRRFPQMVARDWLPKPQRDGRARFRRQDVPHFRFAAWAVLPIVRMHLHAQPLRCEDQLDQQRQIAFGQEPGFADGLRRVWKPWGQARRAPHLLPKRRRETNGLVHNYEFFTMNPCRRSRPRASSFIDVAYEIRMCRSVPNASPGTTARCTSASSRSASCCILPIPFLPSTTPTFGYA